MREFEDRNKPGRIDVNGEEWWACDPYPTWFRWEGNELITPVRGPRWPEESKEVTCPECGGKGKVWGDSDAE